MTRSKDNGKTKTVSKADLAIKVLELNAVYDEKMDEFEKSDNLKSGLQAFKIISELQKVKPSDLTIESIEDMIKRLKEL